MTILIASANQSVVTTLSTSCGFKIEHKASTKNTSTFTCSTANFTKLQAEARLMGYNPYALFSW